MFLGALDQTIIAAALPAIAGSLGGLSISRGWSLHIPGRDYRCSFVRVAWEMPSDASACWSYPWAYSLPVRLHVRWLPLSPFDLCSRATGFGGGGLMTLAQALIGEVVSPRERGKFKDGSVPICSCQHTRSGDRRHSFPTPRLAQHFLGQYPAGAGRRDCCLARQNTSRDRYLSIGTMPEPGVFVASTVALLLALSIGGHEVLLDISSTARARDPGESPDLLFFVEVEQKTVDPLSVRN